MVSIQFDRIFNQGQVEEKAACQYRICFLGSFLASQPLLAASQPIVRTCEPNICEPAGAKARAEENHTPKILPRMCDALYVERTMAVRHRGHPPLARPIGSRYHTIATSSINYRIRSIYTAGPRCAIASADEKMNYTMLAF